MAKYIFMWTYWIIAFFAIQLIHFLGTWHLYQKAGRKAWEAAIPVYNAIVLFKIMERPWWWVFMLFIPIIAPIAFLIIWVDFIRCYGKRSLTDALLVIFTLGFYIFYLNYVEKPAYVGAGIRTETLIASLLFAVILATFIHQNVVQPYTIPTGSMEKTLLVGDFLFVSKATYGLRLPMTPVALPFLQSAVPFTGKPNDPQTAVKSYVGGIKTPYTRLPAFKKVERNDIVVFNFPEDSVNTSFDRNDPYVKRCVGLPGDSIRITDGTLYVNGKIHQLPADNKVQFGYTVISKVQFSEQLLKESFGYLEHDDSQMIEGNYGYTFHGLTTQEAADFKKMPSVISITRNIAQKDNSSDKILSLQQIEKKNVNYNFPLNKNWNMDQYGTLAIPKKGDKIILTKDNIAQYYRIITRYYAFLARSPNI